MNIKFVAQKAGVSVTTVSRVLNHPESVSKDTRESILAVMEEINYVPNWFARNIQTNKTNMIGLLLPDVLDPANMEIAKGVEEIAHQKNYNIMLCNTEYNAEKEIGYINKLAERKIDGFIITSTFLKKKAIKSLDKQNIPFVFVGKTKETEGENLVYTNEREASEEAVEYLITSGRKNIAIILPDTSSYDNAEKLDGYKNAMKKSGLLTEAAFIEKSVNNIEGGFIAAGKLLSKNIKPDAVFATSDMMAFGAIERFKQAGVRVPEDIAVIGYGDVKVGAVMEPKLTTVSKPAYRMGLIATRLLFDIFEDESAPVQQIFLQSNIKIRKSCGNKERLKEIW